MPTLILTESEWVEICEAVDYMAGGNEICADLWPKLMDIKIGDGIIIAKDTKE